LQLFLLYNFLFFTNWNLIKTGITQSTLRLDLSDVSGSHMDLNLMLGVQVLF